MGLRRTFLSVRRLSHKWGKTLPEKSARRKLAAILSADVKGYSRLMEDDEEATVQTITAYREEMISQIERENGRVVDAKGDNLLAEFSSVIDAIHCAVEIQTHLKLRNEKLPEHRRMEFRIGLNLGDVIEEGGAIYGDGVNIAARLEGLADGGGICISGTVFDQVWNKLRHGYEFLGEQKVKNISRPIRAYCLIINPETAGSVIGGLKPKRKHQLWFFVGVVIASTLTILSIFYYSLRPDFSGISKEKMSSNRSRIPAIAVLPFDNLSDDPEQEYFSDGITNDIITDLSKFHDLLVIASNTMFTYKGRPVNVKEVADDLEVQYVLEGSVQKSKETVRINAQLILASTGHHVWAERYDRDIRDLFEVQEKIVQAIVRALAVKIYEQERTQAKKKRPESLDAYDLALRGWDLLRARTRPGRIEASMMFKKAIDLDPSYSSAYFGLARCHLWDLHYGWTEFPDKSLQEAQDLAQQGLNLEPSAVEGHVILGSVYALRGQYDLAMDELEQAIRYNPNDPQSQSSLGQILLYYGKTDEAIKHLELLMRLDPIHQLGAPMHLGLAYYLKGRYEDAIKFANKGMSRRPDFSGFHVVLAAAYARLGRNEDASREAEKVLELDPFFDLDSYGTAFRNRSDRQAIIEGLSKAGLK
jgi:adenylate cyclase